MEKFVTKSPAETEKLGEKIGRRILREEIKRGAKILALEGCLGGGKTTFLKGFAKGLGVREKILSPTFIIMRKFKIRVHSCPNSCKFANFYHIDCYRIEKPREILNLGFKEIIKNPKNIVAIEWADRIRQIIPKEALQIKFKILSKNQRQIMIIPVRPVQSFYAKRDSPIC
jgi:tRNA threonylcarbamoyladenosine biosynthesis protein TsaE